MRTRASTVSRSGRTSRPASAAGLPTWLAATRRRRIAASRAAAIASAAPAGCEVEPRRPVAREPLRVAAGASRASSACGPLRVEPDDHHPPAGLRDRLDPLGRVAQDQARHAEPGRLALDAARVGQDGRRVELERERRPVALRLDDADARAERGSRPRRARRRVPGWSARTTGRPVAATAPQQRRPGRERRRAPGSRRGGPSRRGSRPAAAPGDRRSRLDAARPPGRATSGAIRAARSCIRSPTSVTPSTMPSAARFATAVGVGANSQRERWSATTRLISSGIAPVERAQPGLDVGDRDAAASPRPARRRASSSCRRRRGRRRAARASRIGSSAVSIRPVCSRLRAAADPQASGRAGAGPSSAKNAPAIASSQCWPVSTKTSSWRAPERRRQRRRLDQLGPRPDDADDPHAAGVAARRPGLRRRARSRPARRSRGTRRRRQGEVAQAVAAVEHEREVREPAPESSVANSGSRGLGHDRPDTGAGSPQRHGVAPAARDLVGA